MNIRSTTAFVAVALTLVAAPAHPQDLGRLSIHGHISQAFGIADTGQFLGIGEDGTTNYGTMALQFRYTLGADDNLTIQLSNRRLGASPMTQGESAVDLDWAFYARRFGNFEAKVGRIAIPVGIYNEVRDVGVLLPFYRAPFNFYQEGAYTSETVDGVVASYTFGSSSSWGIELSGYAGGWNMTDRVEGEDSYMPYTTRATNGVGGQVWMNTPIDGVRAGAGVSRVETDVAIVGGVWEQWNASFDVSLSRFTVQSELRSISFPNGSYKAYYGYVGVRPIPQLTLSAMADYADLDLDLGILFEIDYNDEYTLGASWAVSPNFILKGELHRAKGFVMDLPVLDPTVDEPATINYALLSVAASF